MGDLLVRSINIGAIANSGVHSRRVQTQGGVLERDQAARVTDRRAHGRRSVLNRVNASPHVPSLASAAMRIAAWSPSSTHGWGGIVHALHRGVGARSALQHRRALAHRCARRLLTNAHIRYAVVGLGHIAQVAVLPAFAQRETELASRRDRER